MTEGERNGEEKESKRCGENHNVIIRISEIQMCVHICVCVCGGGGWVCAGMYVYFI